MRGGEMGGGAQGYRVLRTLMRLAGIFMSTCQRSGT